MCHYCPYVAIPACPKKVLREGMLNESRFSPHCPPAGDQRCDQGLGLEVGRVELAVGAVLQPPQDSLAGPGLHSPLQ